MMSTISRNAIVQGYRRLSSSREEICLVWLGQMGIDGV
jgi:hypothetical protein